MSNSDVLRCSLCGLTLAGGVCEACGGTAEPLPLADGEPLHEVTLESEFDASMHRAWSEARWVEVLRACLDRVGARHLEEVEVGTGRWLRGPWSRHALLVHASDDGELTVEVPVARLPATSYVPALRYLLEASDGAPHGGRLSARFELALARFVGPLAKLRPSAVVAQLVALEGLAANAERYLVTVLRARPISPVEIRAAGFELWARAQDGAVRVPTTQGVKRTMVTSVAPPALTTTPSASIPIVAPAPRASSPGGSAARLASRAEERPIDASIGGMPIEHEGSAPRTLDPARSELRPNETTALEPPASLEPATVHDVAPKTRPMLASHPASTQEPPAPASTQEPPAPGTVPRKESLRPPTAGADSMASGPETAPVLTPEFAPASEGLLELFHRTLRLGTVLSFADQPATMCLLVRATIYRAAHLFAGEPCVAVAWEAASALLRTIVATDPSAPSRVVGPPTTPAFDAMNAIVADGGALCTAPAPRIEPITSAQEAKSHLGRYASEIELAPADLELRHHLLVGAFAELLVRTKLPPNTQDRLRAIMAKSAADGPTKANLELMSTALARMIG